jgi:Protein of unknown function (DUF2735)
MSRASATIYTFPPRGRFAIREEILASPADAPAGVSSGVSPGSGWYHEEAIQAAREAEQNRKN